MRGLGPGQLLSVEGNIRSTRVLDSFFFGWEMRRCFLQTPGQPFPVWGWDSRNCQALSSLFLGEGRDRLPAVLRRPLSG